MRVRVASVEELDAWLDRVADGKAAMSQRRLSELAGAQRGLPALRDAAHARGLRFEVFQDENGVDLVAVSRFPIGRSS